MLVVRSADTKKTIAVDMTYSMHPTVLHEDNLLVSADFPGYAKNYVEEALGGVPIYRLGTGGNQSPRRYVSGQTFDEAERLGKELGARVVNSVRQVRDSDFTGAPPLAGQIEKAMLSPRSLPSMTGAEEMLARRLAIFESLKKENAERAAIRTAECDVFGAQATLGFCRLRENGDLDRILKIYMPADVQVVRIGEACLAGLPGEVFVEYGLAIKKKVGIKTFVVSLVNGDLRGYLATPEAAEAGRYEATNSIWEAGQGEVVVDVALRLVQKLSGMDGVDV